MLRLMEGMKPGQWHQASDLDDERRIQVKKYPNLFKPITIGSLTLGNRIEVAPMGYCGTPEGYLTRAGSAFYEMRAKGGAAVVTLGESLVDSKTGKAHDRIIPLDDPGILPSLINTTDAIKQHGARASIELIHAGQRANPNYTEDRKVYGPSAGDSVYGGPILEMDESLIEKIVEAFGDAAEMAKFGGVDMCMVHGGHGWLLAIAITTCLILGLGTHLILIRDTKQVDRADRRDLSLFQLGWRWFFRLLALEELDQFKMVFSWGFKLPPAGSQWVY